MKPNCSMEMMYQKYRNITQDDDVDHFTEEVEWGAGGVEEWLFYNIGGHQSSVGLFLTFWHKSNTHTHTHGGGRWRRTRRKRRRRRRVKIPKEEPIVFCSTNAIVGHRRILSFFLSSFFYFFSLLVGVFPPNWLLKNLFFLSLSLSLFYIGIFFFPFYLNIYFYGFVFGKMIIGSQSCTRN